MANNTLKRACLGGLVLAALTYVAYPYFPRRSISITESGVTWTYKENRKLFQRPSSCMLSLSNGEITEYLTDEHCDGSVDSYHSVNIKNGKTIAEVYAFRAEATEREFKEYDEFFEIVKESLLGADKK